jgi:hypothetical protein
MRRAIAAASKSAEESAAASNIHMETARTHIKAHSVFKTATTRHGVLIKRSSHTQFG